MSSLGPLVGWGVVVAASLVAGSVAAAVLRLPARVAAAVTSFGGGVLLAAVALELVPDAHERAGPRLRSSYALSVLGRNSRRPRARSRLCEQDTGKKGGVIVAVSTVAIVAIAAVVIVALITLMYILPRGGRRSR